MAGAQLSAGQTRIGRCAFYWVRSGLRRLAVKLGGVIVALFGKLGASSFGDGLRELGRLLRWSIRGGINIPWPKETISIEPSDRNNGRIGVSASRDGRSRHVRHFLSLDSLQSCDDLLADLCGRPLTNLL